MKKQAALLVLIAGVFGYLTIASAITVEEAFKAVATKIAALDQKAIKSGKTDIAWTEKSREYRATLKKIIAADPKGLWADDSQFLIGILSEADKLDTLEKENFLKWYPDGQAQDWTKKQLDYIVPSKLPLDLAVRMDLCLVYIRRGEASKLKALAEESAVKYPDRAVYFKTISKKLGSSS